MRSFARNRKKSSASRMKRSARRERSAKLFRGKRMKRKRRRKRKRRKPRRKNAKRAKKWKRRKEKRTKIPQVRVIRRRVKLVKVPISRFRRQTLPAALREDPPLNRRSFANFVVESLRLNLLWQKKPLKSFDFDEISANISKEVHRHLQGKGAIPRQLPYRELALDPSPGRSRQPPQSLPVHQPFLPPRSPDPVVLARHRYLRDRLRHLAHRQSPLPPEDQPLKVTEASRCRRPDRRRRQEAPRLQLRSSKASRKCPSLRTVLHRLHPRLDRLRKLQMRAARRLHRAPTARGRRLGCNSNKDNRPYLPSLDSKKITSRTLA
mmetsp:Transcript_6249/g.20922  ORF Transcript_6249/g.20922 Transcript_6249/m.20922 type:complete len:321 (-) Transcript_6249:266-1228(-)